jgi:hypothetical protein
LKTDYVCLVDKSYAKNKQRVTPWNFQFQDVNRKNN